MTPKDADNIVAAGRAVDGDVHALSAIRVMGPCIAMGAAAAHALDLAGTKPCSIDCDAQRSLRQPRLARLIYDPPRTELCARVATHRQSCLRWRLIATTATAIAQSGSTDEKFRALPKRAEHPRQHAAAGGAAASCRLAVQQRKRRVDARAVQGLGLGRADRAVRRPLPDAERTRARDDRADEVRREARRACRRRRSRRADRRPSSCRRTTRTRSTATSRRRSSTSTTAASKTTTSSNAWASPPAAPSSSSATAGSSAA